MVDQIEANWSASPGATQQIESDHSAAPGATQQIQGDGSNSPGTVGAIATPQGEAIVVNVVAPGLLFTAPDAPWSANYGKLAYSGFGQFAAFGQLALKGVSDQGAPDGIYAFYKTSSSVIHIVRATSFGASISGAGQPARVEQVRGSLVRNITAATVTGGNTADLTLDGVADPFPTNGFIQVAGLSASAATIPDGVYEAVRQSANVYQITGITGGTNGTHTGLTGTGTGPDWVRGVGAINAAWSAAPGSVGPIA